MIQPNQIWTIPKQRGYLTIQIIEPDDNLLSIKRWKVALISNNAYFGTMILNEDQIKIGTYNEIREPILQDESLLSNKLIPLPIHGIRYIQ